MKSYVLRIELPIPAPDDPAAREQALALLRQLGVPAEAHVKLQERSGRGAPRPVFLPPASEPQP